MPRAYFNAKKDEKKKILEEQLNIIHSEKNKVDADVKVKKYNL